MTKYKLTLKSQGKVVKKPLYFRSKSRAEKIRNFTSGVLFGLKKQYPKSYKKAKPELILEKK